MTSSPYELNLNKVFDQLMMHHVQLGKLIFAPALRKLEILKEIEAVASFLDETMTCSQCKLSSIPSIHFFKEEGIVCDKCQNETDRKPEKECDILLTDAISSCLFNTSIMMGFLLESLMTQNLSNDGEESDDPEVQFPFFPNKTSPAKWNKSNAKLYLAAKKFLARFEKPASGIEEELVQTEQVSVVPVEELSKDVTEVKDECVTEEACPESKISEDPIVETKARSQGDNKAFKVCTVVVRRLDESNLTKSYNRLGISNNVKPSSHRPRSICKRNSLKLRPGPHCKKLSL